MTRETNRRTRTKTSYKVAMYCTQIPIPPQPHDFMYREKNTKKQNKHEKNETENQETENKTKHSIIR